jgi:hypothetical protein
MSSGYGFFDPSCRCDNCRLISGCADWTWPTSTHLLAWQSMNLCLNLPEGRLVESYPTVVIPLYKGIVFVRLLNCSEFSSRLSEVAQAHDTISGS